MADAEIQGIKVGMKSTNASVIETLSHAPSGSARPEPSTVDGALLDPHFLRGWPKVCAVLFSGIVNVKSKISSNGFTLVELLVVMAVISVLASLLLPALSTVKSAAQSAQCKSNLRQLSLAVNMYVNDFRCYPQHDYSGHIWVDPLNALYLKQPPNPFANTPPYAGVFSCPSDLQRRARAGQWSYGYNAFGPAGHAVSIVTLGKKGFGLGVHIPFAIGPLNSGSAVPETPTLETDVEVPSDLIAIGDSFGGHLDKTNLSEGNSIIAKLMELAGAPAGDGARMAQKRHRGKLNVTFCDGHVETIKIYDLYFLETDETYQRWSRDHEVHRGVP